jgi:hypothetical protein
MSAGPLSGFQEHFLGMTDPDARHLHKKTSSKLRREPTVGNRRLSTDVNCLSELRLRKLKMVTMMVCSHRHAKALL